MPFSKIASFLPAAKELTQTPLLLTLVCLLYQRSRKFPTNRATLYERALRVLLEEWAADEGKETHQEEIYKGLDTKRKEMLLAKIAHDAFQQNRLFLTHREIAHQIEVLLKEMLPDEKNIDGAAVLRIMEVQHGILVERAEGIYSFSHLTLQEYLTAQYVDDHRKIKLLITEHLTDERWQEIFLLVAGLMRGGVDELLLRLYSEAEKQLNTLKLQELICWANQVTNSSEGVHKPAAKRATAIFHALTRARVTDDSNRTYVFTRNRVVHLAGAIDLELSAALPLGNIFNSALASEYEKMKVFSSVNFTALIAQLKGLEARVPNESSPLDVQRTFVNSVLQTWYEAFKLNQELVNFSETEAMALNKYLYANKLIVLCKEAAVRVSPQVWAVIEKRILTMKKEG